MRHAALIFALLSLASCKPAPQAVVDATRYNSFWLWAGVKPQPVFLKPGQVMRLGVQGLGEQRQRTVAWAG